MKLEIYTGCLVPVGKRFNSSDKQIMCLHRHEDMKGKRATVIPNIDLTPKVILLMLFVAHSCLAKSQGGLEKANPVT